VGTEGGSAAVEREGDPDARAARPYPWPELIAGAVAVWLIIRLAWNAGGYFPPDYVSAGAIGFVALAILLAAQLPRYRVSTHALVGLGALAGLAAWTGLSATWAISPYAALDAANRALVYVAVFGLGIVAAGSGRFARQLVWAVLAAMLVVVGAGLLSRVYPELVPSTLVGPEAVRFRLAYPLSYWNAFGALAAAGTVLAFGLSADPRTRVPLRGVAAAIAVLMFVAMYLSLSRGAWLAMILGGLVVAALSAYRGSVAWSLVIVGAASVVAIIRLQSYPALIDDPTKGIGQVAAGHRYGPQLIFLAVLAGAAQGVIAAGRASPEMMSGLRSIVRPLAIGAAVIVGVFAIVAYGLRAGKLEGWSANRLDDASSFITRQWDDFLRPSTFSTGGTARLTSAKGSRSDLFRVAFDGFEASPLHGEGGGSFEYRWMRTRRVEESVRNAHSLEFETLGELGLVGGALLLVFLGSMVLAAIRSRMRPGGLGRSQSAAVAGACAVWVGHSFVDWDWQMPALTGAIMVLAASLYPYGQVRRRRRSPADPIIESGRRSAPATAVRQ
jgi:O-antigen ligase